ncbi:transposase, partial [Candidatus Saccharibacteria bacterium]|nr:transposase [Candidatus Saccharibacteria bacterium]
MPRNPKLFIHGCAYPITFRAQTGLPLACHKYMKTIIESKLAQAARVHPVILSDCTIMANHPHLTIVVIDPNQVDQFVKHLKAETAHIINRLFGIPKRNVWEEGYDSPNVLDLESLIERTIYTYSNPQKANLVDTIE